MTNEMFNEEQERVAFEAWASKDGAFPGNIKQKHNGDYKHASTFGEWIGWQARARLAASSHELSDDLAEKLEAFNSAKKAMAMEDSPANYRNRESAAIAVALALLAAKEISK